MRNHDKWLAKPVKVRMVSRGARMYLHVLSPSRAVQALATADPVVNLVKQYASSEVSPDRYWPMRPESKWRLPSLNSVGHDARVGVPDPASAGSARQCMPLLRRDTALSFQGRRLGKLVRARWWD